MDRIISFLLIVLICVSILFTTSSTIKNFAEIKAQNQYQLLALQQTLKLLQENK